MSGTTHADAELILRLFELRREGKMRKARHWFLFEYEPRPWEAMKADHFTGAEHDNYLRMVTSYWNMACAMVSTGALDRDLFYRTCSEFLIVWQKVQPWLEEARRATNRPYLLKDMEEAALQYKLWSDERSAAVQSA